MNLPSNRRYNSNGSGSSSSAPMPPHSPSANTIQGGVRGFSVPVITSVRLASETDNNVITSFTRLYEDHCKEIFSLLTSNLPEQVHDVMMAFYNDLPEEYVRAIQNIPELTEAVWRWDCILYDVSSFKRLDGFTTYPHGLTFFSFFLFVVNHSTLCSSRQLPTYSRYGQDIENLHA